MAHNPMPIMAEGRRGGEWGIHDSRLMVYGLWWGKFGMEGARGRYDKEAHKFKKVQMMSRLKA